MIRIVWALRPVLLLGAVLAALDTGVAADLAQGVLNDSLAQHCCVVQDTTAPGVAQYDELTGHLNEVSSLARRFADVGGISLSPSLPTD